MSSQAYLLADQPSELERLQLQSRVWEPSGRRLLDEIGEARGARVLDVGCGAIGWLRLLSEWVGPDGEVVGTDIDDAMLAAAGQFVEAEGLGNVVLVKDDLFASKLESASFDLVHARFQIAPLGRGPEQVSNHVRLLQPTATVVLEEWDVSSWHFNPPARALESLVELIGQSFLRSGGDTQAGLKLLDLLRGLGVEGNERKAKPSSRSQAAGAPPPRSCSAGASARRSSINLVLRFRRKPVSASAYPVDAIERVVRKKVSAPTYPPRVIWTISDGSRSRGLEGRSGGEFEEAPPEEGDARLYQVRQQTSRFTAA